VATFRAKDTTMEELVGAMTGAVTQDDATQEAVLRENGHRRSSHDRADTVPPDRIGRTQRRAKRNRPAGSRGSAGCRRCRSSSCWP
jgi:hypothetical protein